MGFFNFLTDRPFGAGRLKNWKKLVDIKAACFFFHVIILLSKERKIFFSCNNKREMSLIQKKESDIDIVKKVLDNQDYFSVIIERYESKLRRYIRRITNIHDEEIDDLLQDIFISVYQNLNSFNPDLQFSSWIYRIAHNKTINYWKKNKKEIENISVDENLFFIESIFNEENILLDLEREENAQLLNKALQKLDPKYREVLILKFIEDKDYTEISDILEKPMGSIATLINRGKKQLKKEIENLIPKENE